MKKFFIKSDILGISAASLCLVHCMVFPVIMLFGGAVHTHDGHSHSHETWSFFDFGFLAIGLIAVIFSSKSSSSKITRFVMWFTFITLALSIIFRSQLHWLEYIAYVASIALIGTHFYNMYRGNSCEIPLGSRS